MTRDKPKPAMQLIVDALKKNPRATYAEVKAIATARKLRIYPIMYGRAQAMLRIVSVRPRGHGKVRARRSEAGRPAAGSVPADSLEELLSAVRDSEAERVRYRQALERIRDLLSQF